MTTELHYIYDPLCSWCYAVTPLINAAAEVSQINMTLHGVGLWINNRRKPTGEALRSYLKPHSEYIHVLTGQPFGERYFNELMLDSSHLLDSQPLIHSILAIEYLGGNTLVMLKRIQQTHYREGVWAGGTTVLAELAAEQGISAAEFIHAKEEVNVVHHMSNTHVFMEDLQVLSHPGLVLQQGDNWQLISLSPFIGQVEKFKQHLSMLIKRNGTI